MNNIRGFSYNVPTRDAAPTAEARNGVPELPEAGSGPNIFESVLTGVSQGNDREARQAPLSTPQQAGSQADSAAQKGVGSSGQKDVGSLEFRLGTFTGSLAGLAETQASSRVFPDFPETGGSLNRARDQKVSADGESPLAASIADAASMGVSAPDLPASKSAPAIKASQAAITAKDLPKIPNSASKSAPQTATNSVQNNPAFFSPKTRAIASFNPVSLSNGTQAMAQNATAAPRNGRGSQDSSVAPTSVTPSKRRATEASQPASASNTGPVVAVPILPNFALPVSAPLPVETPDGSSSAPAQRQINLQNRDGQASQLGGQGQSIEMKANVISAATHFAPVATLSPVQQIADFITVAASSADPSSGSSASASPDVALPVSTRQSASSIKTLDLQLEPASLGQVTIRLSLSAGELSLQMQATESSTVSLIEKEKQSLSDQLGQSGYTVSGVEIRLAAPAPQVSDAASGFGNAQTGGGSSGGSTSGGSNDSSARGRNSQNPGLSQDGAARRHTADLYV